MTHGYSAAYSAWPWAARFGGYHALGGGGLAHWLVRLFIWHEIWRLILLLWRIPRFGPVIVVVIALAIVAGGLLTSRWRRGGFDRGSGAGPRDW